MHIVSKGQCCAMMAAPSSSFSCFVLGFGLMPVLADMPPFISPCCDDTTLPTSLCMSQLLRMPQKRRPCKKKHTS
uniref:Putative secreted protein salivary gland overexpressed n=1 Tax=Rhipicephalus microplus TaxID=6941 RepID=A0A6M2DBB9_RHIMP